MSNVKIQCGHCGGSGEVEITGVYAETMEYARTYTRVSLRLPNVVSPEFTGALLAQAYAGCKASAMNNRLARLEQLGLLTSRRYGRVRLFKVKS